MSRPMHLVTRRIVGAGPQVGNVLRSAQARGHLVSYRDARRIGADRVTVTVTLLEPAPRLRRLRVVWRAVRRNGRNIGIGCATVAVAGVVGALLWLGWLLVQWLAAHWVSVVVVAVAVLILAGAISASGSASGSGVCAGSHCRGCGHR